MISKFKKSKALFWPKSQGKSDRYGRFGHFFPFRPIPEKQLRKHTIKFSLMTFSIIKYWKIVKSLLEDFLYGWYLAEPAVAVGSLETDNLKKPWKTIRVMWRGKVLELAWGYSIILLILKGIFFSSSSLGACARAWWSLPPKAIHKLSNNNPRKILFYLQCVPKSFLDLIIHIEST